MNVSRGEFLKGALSSLGFGAFGWRVFAAPPGWKRPDKANLVFGMVSDTHLRSDMTGLRLGGTGRYLLAAFRYFRSQNVDAVAHCGDMADRGQVSELEFHATIWNKVFPKNAAPDGHKVEKLFVAGNHDLEGFRYGLAQAFRVDRIFPDPVEATNHLLAADFPAHWERIWGEKYDRVWHKVVKGYHFLGRHWDVPEEELKDEIARCRGQIGGERPFFLLSHDKSRRLGDPSLDLGNAVGFFGHWHCSAANWNQIHFFPRYSFPCIQVPSSSIYGRIGFGMDKYISSAPLEGGAAEQKGFQGYVVRVYDDFLAIERCEFSKGGTLGPDWIMPLEKRPVHPFAKAELKKVIGKPEFRSDAKLSVEPVSAPACLRVRIPLADGNPESRVYAYEVVVSWEKAKLVKAVYAKGVHMGVGHEPDGGITTLDIPKAELPSGKALTFKVKPLSSLGTFGTPLEAEFAV